MVVVTDLRYVVASTERHVDDDVLSCDIEWLIDWCQN